MTEKDKSSSLINSLASVVIFIFAITLIVLSVSIFVALWTYSVRDSGWSHNDGDVIKNSLGVIGAWYSDFSFSLLGKPSYLIPFAFFIIALHAWFEKGVDKELLSWRLIMLLTAVFSACVLWTKHDPQVINTVAQTGGGALGAWLVIGLEKSVKSVPVIMGFSLVIFAISLSLLLNFPWLKVIDWLGGNISRLFSLLLTRFFKAKEKKPQKPSAKDIFAEPKGDLYMDSVSQKKVDTLNKLAKKANITNITNEEKARPKFTIDRYEHDGSQHDSHESFARENTLNESLLKENFGIPPRKSKPVEVSPKNNVNDIADLQSKKELSDAHAEIPKDKVRFPTTPNGVSTNGSVAVEKEDSSSFSDDMDSEKSEPMFFDFGRIKKSTIKGPSALPQKEDSQEQTQAPLHGYSDKIEVENALVEDPVVDNQAIDDISAQHGEKDLSGVGREVELGEPRENAVASINDDHSLADIEKPIFPQKLETENKATIGKAYDIQSIPDAPIATPYQLPSVDLLDTPLPQNNAYTEDALAEMAGVLEITLKQFNVEATVMHVSPGPVITRFEIDLAPGIQAKKITNLSQDLARALAVSRVRVEEVIAGSSYVGLEVPNQARQTVYFKDVVRSKVFQNSKSPLTLSLGADTSGKPVVADLMKMPHALVAGTTGSGKSVCINVMLLSMLYKASPKDLRLILVDPKMLEMSMYEDIPHLLTPVITEMNEAENALTWAVGEMERRYRLMAALKVRKIDAFNELVDSANAVGEAIKDPLWEPNESVGYTHHPNLERLPFIVVVIDELADMMMVVGKQVEQLIARLTQKARAAGIHVVLATQRPSTDVLTGLIKANVPTRIAFQVSSGTDSRVIIDGVGAEKLLGHGDMLYVPPGASHPQRLHGAFVGDSETDRITAFLRSTGEPNYIKEIIRKQALETLGAYGAAEVSEAKEDADPLYEEAIQIVLQTGKASISSVQRQLRIGYNRAARMIEDMQEQGIISEPINGVRKVLVSAPSEDGF